MANQKDCPCPVNINGFNITPEIIDALELLSEDSENAQRHIGKAVLWLLQNKQVLDDGFFDFPDFAEVLYRVFNLYNALIDSKKGGGK